MTELPMFPLGSVLLPTTLLPLRLFEPRYLQLIEAVMSGGREFGVALIERGNEVGGGDQRTNIGCVAQVLEASQIDGMWHVVAAGTRRFTVDKWLEDDPYPRALVTDIEELPATAGDASQYQSVRDQLRTVLALLSETGVRTGPIPELAEDAALGSFQVAAVAPFGAFDRQRLLAANTPGERLTLLVELLDGAEQDLRAQLSLG